LLSAAKMAANDSYPRQPDADEFKVAKFKKGFKSFTDPDRGWKYCANPDYSHDKWDSTPLNTWEKRVATDSAMDSFSGFNWNKMPTEAGEYYGKDPVPIVKNEFDEEAYWNNAKQPKTAEELHAELDAGRVALEEKWESMKPAMADFPRIPIVPMWTPAMSVMTTPTPIARKLNFELAPVFQLNKLGYRKNWANIAVSEMRPIMREFGVADTHLSDYLLRFQMQRMRHTMRPRHTEFKVYLWLCLATAFLDMFWAKQYRQTRIWH